MFECLNVPIKHLNKQIIHIESLCCWSSAALVKPSFSFLSAIANVLVSSILVGDSIENDSNCEEINKFKPGNKTKAQKQTQNATERSWNAQILTFQHQQFICNVFAVPT